MKRSSPLKRRAPLNPGSKPLRKTRLKSMSPHKASFYRDYCHLKAIAPLEMECADCGTPWMKSCMEPHHPAGRSGPLLLVFVWLCRPCHLKIHFKAKWARRTGRILPEIEGRKSTDKTPNYFNLPLP